MGGKTTKLFKGSSHQQPAQAEDCSRYREQPACRSDGQSPPPPPSSSRSDETVVTDSGGSPFVRYRRGSMYMDEDGDIAHEFYVETKQGTNLTLKQISNNLLTPQGDVLLDVPCIRNDYPVVLLDQSKVKE